MDPEDVPDELTDEDWEELFDDFGFEDCCVDAFEVVMGAWLWFLEHQPAEFDATPVVATRLSHGPVASAVASLIVGEGDGGDEVDAFTSALVASARGHDAAGPLLVRAINADHQGRPLDAELDLAEAVRRQPEAIMARAMLAEYAAIRGDAARAARLLVEAGMPPDAPEVVELRSYLADDGWPTVGRNEPCPCGSGRKYKQCHQGARAVLPIERRSSWLVGKVAAFVGSERPELAIGLASTASRSDLDDDELVTSLVELADDPFLRDVAMIEGGGLELFLQRRGELLPDDELELADTWLTCRRRLWEVTGVEPGASLTLRDTTSGDVVTVAERIGSMAVDVGEYRLGIVVPVGAEHQFLSVPLAIDLRHRESVLQLVDGRPTADEIAAWYGWATAPPQLQNREGEELVAHLVRVTPAVGWDDFAAGLDEHFDAEPVDDPGRERWLEHVEVGDDIVIRTFLRRDGDDLVVETNSDERWDRVRAVLTAIDPELSLAEEAVDAEGRGDPVDLGAISADALADYMRELEERWLDEEVPALGGLTPRQAADDPTRREDLQALLRAFEQPLGDGIATFDPDRLRQALDLDR